jgi:hypothetical protein
LDENWIFQNFVPDFAWKNHSIANLVEKSELDLSPSKHPTKYNNEECTFWKFKKLKKWSLFWNTNICHQSNWYDQLFIFVIPSRFVMQVEKNQCNSIPQQRPATRLEFVSARIELEIFRVELGFLTKETKKRTKKKTPTRLVQVFVPQ